MSTVTIVGAGYMGSAMAWPLTDNGHEVHLVGTHLDREIIAACQVEHRHPKLGRPLPAGVHPFQIDRLPEALAGATLIVQGVSSAGVEWFARTVGPLLTSPIPILSITKGLAPGPEGRPRILPDLVDSLLPNRLRGQVSQAAVGGPCIAGELAARRPTCEVFTGRDPGLLTRLAAMFRTAYYCVWTSTDVLGVEACVALKNAYALGIALALGRLEAEGGPDAAGAHMHNLAAALFAQAGVEMTRWVEHFGGDPRQVYGLPGIGDLFVTVQGGRSVEAGRLLGLGLPIGETLERLSSVTLESVDVIRVLGQALPQMESAGQLQPGEMPLLQHLVEIVVHGRPVEVPLERMFTS